MHSRVLGEHAAIEMIVQRLRVPLPEGELLEESGAPINRIGDLAEIKHPAAAGRGGKLQYHLDLLVVGKKERKQLHRGAELPGTEPIMVGNGGELNEWISDCHLQLAAFPRVFD